MFSAFFIERPVLANVIALVILLIGGVAFFALPIAQYPDVVPPTVQVTARFPGASAKTVMDTVALPIEQQVNGVDGMIYMQSTSASDGSYTLTVTFAIGTDPDQDQILVQNRVQAALSQLPATVQSLGVSVEKKSTSILEFIALTSPKGKFNSLFLSNYARINLQQELARVPGVGDVGVFGAGEYAMRIWLDPGKLQARGLTPADVINAIKAQNQQISGGQIGAPPTKTNQPFQYTLNISSQLAHAVDFGNVVVKSSPDNGGSLTRVKDVARVELGANSYSQISRINGNEAAAISISQLPGANALEVANAVQKKMAALAKNFPAGIKYFVPFNTTAFVNASVHEVYKTLIEACVIVLVVILFFLQDWRAMLVPATTVPVTLIGAFAAMAAFGFSLNMSTLFALILAIGIVVDDAIVIVEGTASKMEAGMPGRKAAEAAMVELFNPIVGITLVLVSVFLPAAFIPGLTGKLYQQFALVIAATAVISAINAVTLKPTQAALWMRAPKPLDQRLFIFRGFEWGFQHLQNGYKHLLGHAVRHKGVVAFFALTLIGLAFFGMSRVPTTLLPLEDQGYLVVSVQLSPGASLTRTDNTLDEVSKRARAIPGVDNVITVAGVSLFDNFSSLSNSGVAYVVLKPWDQRGKNEGLRHIYEALNAAYKTLPDGSALVIPPPSIQGIGNTGGFTMMVELRDGSEDFGKLGRIATAMVDSANSQKNMSGVRNTTDLYAPQLNVDVDRSKAATLGVNVNDVFNALTGYLGSSYVNQFNRFGQVFQVYTQAESQYRNLERDIGALKVQNAAGDLVPLSTLVTVTPTIGPPLINLYNLYPAATIVGQNQKISSGQAMSLMEQVASHTLPRGTGYDWTAMSYQEKLAGNQIYYVFALAVALVYMVLAGQYESWILPFAVILSVPLAMLGTVMTLLAIGVPSSLYTQIGLILLVALASKNAILIVEFARDMRLKEGYSIIDAALLAGEHRFRPILMTSIAFIVGMLPLVFASGAGASASKSIGIAVVSGMLISTMLAVFVVPSFFVLLRGYEERREARKAKKAASATPAAKQAD